MYLDISSCQLQLKIKRFKLQLKVVWSNLQIATAGRRQNVQNAVRIREIRERQKNDLFGPVNFEHDVISN